MSKTSSTAKDLVGWNEQGRTPSRPQPTVEDLTGWSERKAGGSR